MRFQRYLNEKYFDSARHMGNTYEVFVNPSTSELKDLKAQSGGELRFIFNTETKQIFFWDGSTIHARAFERFTGLESAVDKKFHHSDYYIRGIGADHIFTGDIDSYGNIGSDTWFGDFSNRPTEELLGNMKELQKKDLSWLKKYMDVNKLKYIIKRSIEEVEIRVNKRKAS